MEGQGGRVGQARHLVYGHAQAFAVAAGLAPIVEEHVLQRAGRFGIVRHEHVHQIADDPLFLVAVGAALAGAVYGDHISPISDTTILSSAGAKCNHLRHVATQIPYATLVMIVCFVGYIIAGFTKSPWISLVLGVVLIVIAVLVLVRMEASKKAKA